MTSSPRRSACLGNGSRQIEARHQNLNLVRLPVDHDDAAERERRSALEADIARLQDAAGRSETDWRDRFEKATGDLSDAKAEAAAQRARADGLDAQSRRGLLARMFRR